MPSKRKRSFSASASGVGGSQQPPAKRASAYQPSSEPSAISKIGQLLNEVEELSVTIPTAADRLSSISSLFPHGHLPSAEVVKEATGHDMKILDALKLVVSALQAGFSEFGAKQDVFCRQYERDAVTIERQIREQDVIRGRADRIHDPVLGQSAADAEVTNRTSLLYIYELHSILFMNFSFYTDRNSP